MEQAASVIKELALCGYGAYIVGGAVRDRLMGKIPKDVDILTTAHPETVKRIAKKNCWEVRDMGKAFGISLVIVKGRAYEVATARTEVYGDHSHRPESVKFTTDITLDLSRRDFTINAMAMDTENRIWDPFNGREDIKNGIIRAVGDPRQRFKEDALRPFRAVRFAAELGFEIEALTKASIGNTLDRIPGLSVERVRGELERILLAAHAAKGMELFVETGLAGCVCSGKEKGDTREVAVLPEILHLVDLPQSPRYHRFDGFKHTLAVIENTPPVLSLRLAALFHDIAKGLPGIRTLNKRGELADPGHHRLGAEMTAIILERLRFPLHIKDRVVWLVRNHMSLPPVGEKPVIRWIRKRAMDFKSQDDLKKAVLELLILCRADVSGGMCNPDFSLLRDIKHMMIHVLDSIPFYQNELMISGDRVAEELGPGPEVGKFLRSLLERVQSGQMLNTKEDLENALNKKVLRAKEL